MSGGGVCAYLKKYGQCLYLEVGVLRGNRRIMRRNYHEKRRDDMGLFRVLARLEGGRERERELHAQFQADRLKKNTQMSEWFRMSDDLCCFISTLNPRLRLLSESGKRWKEGIAISS